MGQKQKQISKPFTPLPPAPSHPVRLPLIPDYVHPFEQSLYLTWLLATQTQGDRELELERRQAGGRSGAGRANSNTLKI